jgi:hypothetical protein
VDKAKRKWVFLALFLILICVLMASSPPLAKSKARPSRIETVNSAPHILILLPATNAPSVGKSNQWKVLSSP